MKKRMTILLLILFSVGIVSAQKITRSMLEKNQANQLKTTVKQTVKNLGEQINIDPNQTEISPNLKKSPYVLSNDILDFSSQGTKAHLYSNGPIITHPGSGPGGADFSLLEAPNTSYGLGHAIGTAYMIADDVVINAQSWTIDSIAFYAYQTGSSTTSTINNYHLMVFDGDPANGGTVVWGDTVTNILSTTEWTGVYRGDDTTNSDRPVMISYLNTSGLTLTSGVYWFAWRCGGSGSSGPWAPPITISGQPATGNAIQWNSSTSLWNPVVDGAAQGFPYEVYGTEVPSTCLFPTNLSATNILNTSADLSWTENGTATTWDIEYDTSGFTPTGTPTNVGVTTNPFNLTGLAASTDYDFYVRANCGSGDYSTWIGPYSFTTACDPFVAPITESFDVDATPSCWSQSATSGGPWEFGQLGSADYDAANADEHTGNAGYYAWIDFSGGDDIGVILEMNYVDISALTVPYLQFYLYSHNTNNTDLNILYVEYWDGSAWNNLDTIQEDNGGWTQYNYDITSMVFNTNLVKLRFRAESGGGTDVYYNDLLLDDVGIIEMPSCFDPGALTATNITTTTADLGWTENGTATTWDIEFGASGFTPTGTPTNAGVTTNPFNMTGLTASTLYDFYVRSDCGSSDYSNWVGPYTFATAGCDVSNQCTFTMDMTDGYGDGWNGASVDIIQDGITIASLTIATGSTGTETVDICDGATVELNWTAGGYPDECSFIFYDPFNNEIVNISDGSTLTDGAVFHTFTASCTPPSCPNPTVLTASNITITSADLGWTAGGTETEWQIEYGDYGFTQGNGTYQVVTSNPYSLTGLTLGTAYDYYVRAICGAGDTSIWEGPYSFTTACNMITTFPYTEGFESGMVPPPCWTSLDNDADGFNWEVRDTVGGGWAMHTGAYCAVSASYDNDNTVALTPDNFLISPQFQISSDDLELKFWSAAQDPSYPAEYYAVLVSTTGTNPADFTEIFNETLVDDTWREITLSLSAYNGQNIYIAFRHHNCTDQFFMKLDDVSIESNSSVGQLGNEGIDIYPNPTKGLLNITNISNASVEVYNVLGELLIDKENVSESIDITELPEGNYVVKVRTEKGITTKKINLIK